MSSGAPSIAQLVVSHWQLSWSLSAAAALWALLYLGAMLRVRGHWPLHRALSFLAGIACVVIALESGIGTFDDRMLSVHMVQHMLLLLPAPLLLLAGRPLLLALRVTPQARRARLARGLAAVSRHLGPVACLAMFSGLLLATHLPAFYDATLHHPLLHELEHGLYLLAGTLLWWPILDVDPAPQRRIGGLARLVYVLAAMPAMALIGAYLNRHPTLLYGAYGAPAHALGISAVADQQQAGAIMWVAGNTMMVFVGLWAVVVALLAEERRQQARDARAAAEASR